MTAETPPISAPFIRCNRNLNTAVKVIVPPVHIRCSRSSPSYQRRGGATTRTSAPRAAPQDVSCIEAPRVRTGSSRRANSGRRPPSRKEAASSRRHGKVVGERVGVRGAWHRTHRDAALVCMAADCSPGNTRIGYLQLSRQGFLTPNTPVNTT